jgi:hypothetical protein
MHLHYAFVISLNVILKSSGIFFLKKAQFGRYGWWRILILFNCIFKIYWFCSVIGRTIFKTAFGMMWNWKLVPILKHYYGIFMDEMKRTDANRQDNWFWVESWIRPTYEAVAETSNSIEQWCSAIQSVTANRSYIVWHVRNDADWYRCFIVKRVHTNERRTSM